MYIWVYIFININVYIYLYKYIYVCVCVYTNKEFIPVHIYIVSLVASQGIYWQLFANKLPAYIYACILVHVCVVYMYYNIHIYTSSSSLPADLSSRDSARAVSFI